MGRRQLLVLLGEATRTQLEAAVAASDGGEPDIYIVAPSRVGPLEWLATDEDRAQGEAAARVLEAEWLLAESAAARGEAGDADVVVAVTDALERFPADEIVLVGSGVLDSSLAASLRSFGLPLVLRGVTLGPDSAASRFRGMVRGLVSGRSGATPFVALAVSNLGLFLLLVLGSVVVGVIVWLVGMR